MPVGIAVGLALSQHCKIYLRTSTNLLPASPLEAVRVVASQPQKKPSPTTEIASAPRVLSISARAISTEVSAVSPLIATGRWPALTAVPLVLQALRRTWTLQPEPSNGVAGPKPTGSMEVGEIYRTASALSIYLDEIETRPHIKRLMSMPSLTDPLRILDANQINPNVEVGAPKPRASGSIQLQWTNLINLYTKCTYKGCREASAGFLKMLLCRCTWMRLTSKNRLAKGAMELSIKALGEVPW